MLLMTFQDLIVFLSGPLNPDALAAALGIRTDGAPSQKDR